MTDPTGNPDPNPNQGAGNPDPKAGAGAGAGAGNKWYASLEGDLATHPAIQKFENPTALARGYIEAEKFVGGEKVVNPWKLPEDKRAEGLTKFNEAIGVPKDSKGYALTDVKDIPQGVGFDKAKFGEIAFKRGLRPDQAEGLWQDYTGEFLGAHKASVEAQEKAFNDSETALRSEWGEAYDGNIALAGKFLRHKVKDDAEFERLNSKFSSDPAAIRLLADYGKEFSENSIGGFKDPGSSKMTPVQAQEEYDSIVTNMKDDYYSDVNSTRQRRIKYVEGLIAQGADPTKMG